MLKLKRLLYLLFIPLSAAFIFYFNISNVAAVTVGPIKLELTANQGDIIHGSVFVKNDELEKKTFYSFFESFTEPSGTKFFIKSDTGLPTWIKTASSVTLAPDESRDIPFVIKVPDNAPAGSHSAVIWWSTAPPTQKGQLAVVTRAGILVYLRVAGDVRDEGFISAFTGDTDNFKILFKNTGNTYLVPKGLIYLKNIFGFEQAVFDVNKYGTVVLNESEKELPVELSRKSGFLFGPYRAIAKLSYGEGKTTSASRWLFVFPLKAVLIVVIASVAIIFLFTKGIRRYNQWIIRKAKL